MKKLVLFSLLLLTFLVACQKGHEGIDVEKALKYQVEKESDGKLELVSFQPLSTKEDNPDNPTVHAVAYQATVKAREDVNWGTAVQNKQSRFVLYQPENNYTMTNRERIKAGETREVKYTIVFQKKDGQWLDQFGEVH
ncbi:MAG: hypothetical protein ICV78_09970 [Tolypothrix sp. Co-bin9]|nr:hypothetical protein [Tolypothrix sp. Co-bin9]